MPRIVDHVARRRHVAEVAAEIVASRGVEGLTVRDVAAAAGFSTTVVSHYFVDKRDLLLATYQEAAGRQSARFDEALRRGSPMVGILQSLLPTSESGRRDWKLTIAFWGIAASDPELGSDQCRRVRSFQLRVEELLRREPAVAARHGAADVATLAATLVALTTGLGVQATFDPRAWPARRQRDVLARQVALVVPEL